MSLKNLGEFIRRQRKSLGLTQETLARAADFDQTYITKLEAGKQLGSPDFLVAVATALKIRPGLLLDIYSDFEEPPILNLVEVPEECTEEEIEAGLNFMRFQALERIKRQNNIAPEEIVSNANPDQQSKAQTTVS